MSAMEFDYVVVGGGTAGAIVAARLAEAGQRVALFEAGPSDVAKPQILELIQWPSLLESEYDFDYRIEPQPRGNGAIRHARAKVLGGCSSHNSCIAFYAPDYDLEQWVAAGAAGWSPDEVRQVFHRVRKKVNFDTADAGNPFAHAVVAAAQQAGLPHLIFNIDGHHRPGVGFFDLNKRGSLRDSSSVAYLHPLSQWGSSITFYLNQFISRILIEDGRAVGVETAAGPVRAGKEVIVCCGAFDSPKLLMLSGIGPAEHLKALGIEVQVDLPGVGENLLDHPEGVVNWEITQPMPPEAHNFWEVGIFEKTDPALPAADLMMHLGIQVFDMQTKPAGYPSAEHGFSLTPNVTRAKSQGTVRLRSNRPEDPPVIDFRYFTDPEGHDERVMVAGVKRAREIAAQPALQNWVKRELSPGPEVQSDADISEYVRRTANTVYHPAGTCKMGSVDDPAAVVDPRLRVRGVKGLRVADASIFPTMIGVNPNITIMMIGERCAEMVLEE
ncbi:MAG: GMC family oxidoreductase N-terminal domain-containing protein [Anaerolineales bacterium]|nr:GMC family oxidoreductase N-terminal domain-containing protein [Anaerolineales bacterium]